MLYQFGDCELDRERFELHRDGRLVALEPQVFALLEYLIANRDRVVTRRELNERVWRGRIVTDAALNSRIKAARAAIGDDGKSQLRIRTVHRTGYRFVGQVTELEGTGAVGAVADPLSAVRSDPSPATQAPIRRRFAAAHAVLALAAVVAIAVIVVLARDPPAPAAVARFTIPLTALAGSPPSGRRLALSPDGSKLAYFSSAGLVVRVRDRGETTVVEHFDAFAGAPFFSPDGEWIAYSDGVRLRKVPTSGGAPVTIAEGDWALIASWAPEGIVFADVRGLFRVAADGDVPQPLKMEPAFGPSEQALYPELVSGGRAVLFTVIPTRTITPGWIGNAAGARVEWLDVASGQRKALLRGASRARYLPTGHLIYVGAEGTLFAVPFDATRGELRGDPVEVIADPGASEYAAADDGTLVHESGARSPGTIMVWVDREAREEPLGAPPRRYNFPRLSPDGSRVAVDVSDTPSREVFIWDLRRGALDRFTLDDMGNPLMAWEPDGRRIVFGSDQFGKTNMLIQPADRSAEPERLLESDRVQQPIGFAPDGRLLFSEEVPGRGRDILALSLDTKRIEPIVQSPAADLTATVSPDGRFIAYDSNESGRFEVYVRPYPSVAERRWQVSVDGGREPLWSREGRELFYRDLSGALRAAAVTLEPDFVPGSIATVLRGGTYVGGGPYGGARTYDLSVDGTRFLMLRPVAADDGKPYSVVMVLNWFGELERLSPVR